MKLPARRWLLRLQCQIPSDQQGFIPMMIMIVLALAAVMYFAYVRVSQAQQ